MIIMITTSIVMSLVDEKMKLPWIVIEGTGISNTVPVNVTVFPAGITIEQTPDGICPSCHVAASLKSPVSIAVQTEFGITVVSPPVGPPVPAVVAGGNDASENNIKRFQNNARTKFILLTIRCLSNFSVETNKDEVWTTKR